MNIVGSPGCGKTTLLEALFRHLKDRLAPAVIEGDIAGSIDAERIDALGVPVVQINTERGMPPLDAMMIAAASQDFDLPKIDALIIENVGNLVCTAGFDLGEHLRVVVLSVTEGHDKLIKYPVIFQRSHALVITKTDLLPYTNFSVEEAIEGMKRTGTPRRAVFQVSALRGNGMPEFAEWLAERIKKGRRSVV